jgi:hypothetical protein
MPDTTSIDALFSRLNRSIESDNVNVSIVTPVILKLGELRDEKDRVPDELLDRLLALIGSEAVLRTRVAALILPFFQFEAARLTSSQKRRCLEFLSSKLDQFIDGDALHVATELCEGNYLRSSYGKRRKAKV